jgi:hypothetical protein
MRLMWTGRVFLLLAVMVLVSKQSAVAEITVEKSEKGAVVKADGKPFAEYLMRAGHQPAVWPIIGPTGAAMTRSYPDGPLLDGEMNDHPHHHSLWFTHGDVNGKDFWTEHTPTGKNSEIKHREFVELDSGDVGRIVTRNDWISDGKKVCEDERTLIFGEDESGRYIDVLATITASEGDITFGETKEGSFGVRANAPLTVEAKQGAHIVNNRGHKDDKAWGMFAEWIDDYGPVDGEMVGIAMFSHPDNYQHPTRWHARTYGLLAANPFGEDEFPKDDSQPKQGPKKLAKGEKLPLRYRVLFHKGTPEEAGVEKAYQKFIAK